MTEQVKVEQVDRDAAATIHVAMYGSRTPGLAFILSGERDDDVLVQTFARHRLQHTAGMIAKLEGMKTPHSLHLRARNVTLDEAIETLSVPEGS